MEKNSNQKQLIRYFLFFCLLFLVIFLAVYCFLLLKTEKEAKVVDNSQNFIIPTSTTQHCKVKIKEKIVNGH